MCRRNNPEVLKARAERKAALDAEIEGMQRQNPGRLPTWDDERVREMDRAALQYGRRCIMWDDGGAGFYMMVAWNWVDNVPDASVSRGSWSNAKAILSAPLIDRDIPDDRLAEWLDANTIRIHYKLQERLKHIRKGQGDSAYVLNDDDEYWIQLQKN